MQKLIKLSDTHYIIVDDSEIQEGNKPCYCYNSIKATWDNDIIFYQGTMPMYHYKGFKKITHSTQPLGTLLNASSHKQMHVIEREIKLIPLSEVEETVCGYSVEKMAIKKYGIKNPLNDEDERYYNSHGVAIAEGYVSGFKAHQELVKDKLFTVEQIKKYHNIMCLAGNVKGEEYLRSLLPKTEWDVEFDEQGKLRLV